MLNVGKIEEGFVLDHIKAGTSLSIYRHLQLDKLDCTVAIIKNARSNKMGKKDKEIKNVIHCKNPRCITSIEQGLPHIFVLSDEKKEIYRCKYCEEKFDRRSL